MAAFIHKTPLLSYHYHQYRLRKPLQPKFVVPRGYYGVVYGPLPNSSTVFKPLRPVAVDRNGGVFLVMERSEYDLKKLMEVRKKNKPLSLSQIKHITMEILKGVASLHDSGVMHRDINPANIIVNRRNEVRIRDSGLSAPFPTRWPYYGPRVGTLEYRAPELLQGSCTTHHSSAVDVWAAGCVMAELVLGREMFKGKSEGELLHSIRYVLCTPYNQLRLKMDTEAAFSGVMRLTRSGLDLLERLLEYDPEKRITAREAIDHSWFREVNSM